MTCAHSEDSDPPAHRRNAMELCIDPKLLSADSADVQAD